VFGTGLAVQPVEGQERLTPVVTTQHAINIGSGGPGRFRGGCGVNKGGILTDATGAVMSYCCDRGRSTTWGINGGLPSIPHGVWLNPSSENPRYLGATFSNVAISPGDPFEPPSAGGGGRGAPLERSPAEAPDAVVAGYASIDRATKDYGVVVREIDAELDEYEIDEAATAKERERIRPERASWLDADPAEVARRYRDGEITVHDVIRQYGVVLDWGTGELLEKSTGQFRDSMRARSASFWS